LRPRFLADANFKRPIRSGINRIEPAVDFLSAEAASLRGKPDPQKCCRWPLAKAESWFRTT